MSGLNRREIEAEGANEYRIRASFVLGKPNTKKNRPFKIAPLSSAQSAPNENCEGDTIFLP
jgi:hypothetical protein